MLIDLTGLIINKLEKNYVNVISREKERQSKIKPFSVKGHKEKKMWQKDIQKL